MNDETSLPELRAQLADLSERVRRLESSAVVAPAPSSAATSDLLEREARLAGYGLSRVGIVALVTGVALFIGYGLENFGPGAKVLLGYVAAMGLGGFGHWLRSRDGRLGRILFAGGLAVAYYTTYAMHFVPATRLIDSEALALLLIAGLVGLIVVAAQRLRSETVAAVALFLGLHTSIVSPVGLFTLAANLLIGVAAAFFLIRNRWTLVPASTLVATYLNHCLWIFGGMPGFGSGTHELLHLHASLGFLVVPFVVFTVALALTAAALPTRAGFALPLSNWLGFVSLATFELRHHGLAMEWVLHGGVAAFLLGLAALDVQRQRRGPAFHAHLALGAVSLALALGAELAGSALVLAWSGLSLVALVLAKRAGSTAMRVAATTVLALASASWFWAARNMFLAALVLGAALLIAERLHAAWPSRHGRRLAAAHGFMTAAVGIVAANELTGAEYLTVAWIAVGAALVVVGFLAREPWHRFAGLAVLSLATLRAAVHDLAHLEALYRITCFLLLGVILLAASFLYSRTRNTAST